MERILKMPGRAYDYLYYSYGWVGLMVGGLAVALTIVAVMVWLDRRR